LPRAFVALAITVAIAVAIAIAIAVAIAVAPLVVIPEGDLLLPLPFALAFYSLLPTPYSLFFLSSPQIPSKREIPNNDAAI
jgi:uncharacterized RDD family membrane protein YckC